MKDNRITKYLNTSQDLSLKRENIMKKIFSETNCNLQSMKTKFCIVLLLGTVLTAPVVVLNAHAQGPPSGAPSSGQLTSLADRWTKLILSIDTDEEDNPFEPNQYKGDCSQLIQGKTMFLVGQPTGSVGTVDHGTCMVPSGTSIFFPLYNYVEADCIYPNTPTSKISLCTNVNTPGVGGPMSREQQREIVNNFINKVDVNSLQSTLQQVGNAIDLQYARVQSPPGGFAVKVAANNAFFGDLTQLFTGTASLHAVVDGYWSLLSQPLSPGAQYTLTFGGCQPAGGCQTNIWHLVGS